ncbi:hypothetical protein, partial [Zavarzinella formosa]|uniref:hypothetical protein n=1 Tax=Zavarzinella formosa TaxID=360055 RepID=UPI00187DAB09
MITNYTEQGIPVNVIGQTDEGKLIVQHINTAYDGDGDEYETDGQIEVYSGKLFTDRPKPSDNGL